MAKYAISPQGVQAFQSLAESLNSTMENIKAANKKLQSNVESVMDSAGIYGLELWNVTLKTGDALSDGEESVNILIGAINKQIGKIESLFSLDGSASSSSSSGLSTSNSLGSSTPGTGTSEGQIALNKFGVQSIDSVKSWIGSINHNPGNDPRRNVNCGQCAAAVFKRLNGDNSAVAGLGTYSIPEMNQITGKTQTTMSPDQIKNYLISQGPGSHAVVGVDRASGAGHWFNAYYDGHQVYTIEGQSGEIRGWPPDYGNVVHWDVSM